MKLLNKDEFLANEIKYWVQAKHMQEGDKLPSERELAEIFNVRQGTIRAAFEILEEEGIIEIRDRSGHYLSHSRMVYSLNEITSFTQRVNALGAEPYNDVLFCEHMEVDKELCSKIKLQIGTPVHKITRVRSVLRDGQRHTIAIEYSYVPEDIIPDLEKYDLEKESLFAIITEDYGQKLSRQDQVIEIVYANDFEADILQVDKLTPLVMKRGITYNSKGEVIEYLRTIMKKEWIEFVKDNSRITRRLKEVDYGV